MLDSYFNYKKHKTNFKTEVIAGTSTFLTMAYIMFLNPVILADGGFDFGGVFTATALATALACFICAFYARTWPIGLAPGMGINAFVAFGVVGGMGYEVLKMTAKHRNNIFFRALSKPGLWLQNITTKQPDDNQVEVAIKALEEAFGEKLSQYTLGQTYVAEAIE